MLCVAVSFKKFLSPFSVKVSIFRNLVQASGFFRRNAITSVKCIDPS